MVEISHQVIEKLRTWNLKRENSELDRNFVLTLLLVLVSKDDICHSAISTEVLDFITGMRTYSEKYESLYTSCIIFKKNSFIADLMSIRTQDATRTSAVHKYVMDYCDEKSNQTHKNQPLGQPEEKH